MFETVQFSLALLAAYAYAAIVKPLLQMPGKSGAISAIGVAVVVWLCPLIIAPDRMIVRAITMFVCADLSFKMIDYARHARRRGESGLYSAYLRFLVPFPVLLVVFGERERRLPARPPYMREIAIVCLAGGSVALALALTAMISKVRIVRSCFPLDHAAMLVIFVITIESLSRLLWGLERLARYDTTPIVDKAYLATTPGEFWRRWNTRVGAWLQYNVFRPSGGSRAPIRGVFVTFLVSALFHELAFALATSQFTGYQFTFFILQAPAVVVSHRIATFVNRSGPVIKIVARVLTVLWFYFTSMFFFSGVNRIFPFIYASQPWLP
jgi:MBOAT, membrane-bound O-acyltransferase family